MTDRVLRSRAEPILAPIARGLPSSVHPTAITLVAVVPGLGAGAAAALGASGLALALWLLNRALDALDGPVAREQGRQTDLGAFLDVLLDVIVYTAIPIGLAAGDGSRAAWLAAATVLGAFYVNAISWSYLAALLERRGEGAAARGERTAVTMPAGLVEGAETLVIFALALAVPAWTPEILWAMAGAVAITVGQRVVWAARNLPAPV
jgi:phosphatidylglycerophosphate synthase